ncbi:asparagine synthase C-terminal domain-containing protein [Candidatus Omnitrophota bacterium]
MLSEALKLKIKLTSSIRKHQASGMLLSGGLDSAILAALAPERIKAITVSLKQLGQDRKYARSLVRGLRIKHYQQTVTMQQAIKSIPEVIKVLKTFDPAIPNDLVVYFGLRKARELGIKQLITGDGSDELLAGYSFMQKVDDLAGYIRRITKKMQFSSNRLGAFFGIKIIQPFLDRQLINFALKIDPQFKIKRQGQQIWGKWILRKAFEEILPAEIIWQDKRPLESGSGMSRLRDIIAAKVKDSEFKRHRYPVKLMNKEHFYYYRVYREVIGRIPQAKKAELSCPGCGAGIARPAFHCYTCGTCGTCGWAKPLK